MRSMYCIGARRVKSNFLWVVIVCAGATFSHGALPDVGISDPTLVDTIVRGYFCVLVSSDNSRLNDGYFGL